MLWSGPVVVEEAVTPVGAAGTVVNVVEREGSDGSDVPFALVAVTLAVPTAFAGIPIIVIGEDVPTSVNVPCAPQLITAV